MIRWVLRHTLLAVAVLLVGGLSAARDWARDPAPLEPCAGRAECELGCGATGCLGYATLAGWSEESQAVFVLPKPAHHGPWLLEYVAVYMSGSTRHRIIFREAPAAHPGQILDDSFEFTPAYQGWPPGGWTYVDLRLSLPCPDYLIGDEGDHIAVGLELSPDDAVGLVEHDGDARAWSFYAGTWHDDGRLGAAIRIGLADLGCSENQQATWGRVKGLFK